MAYAQKRKWVPVSDEARRWAVEERAAEARQLPLQRVDRLGVECEDWLGSGGCATAEQVGDAQWQDKDRRPEMKRLLPCRGIKALRWEAEATIEEQNASAKHWTRLAT